MTIRQGRDIFAFPGRVGEAQSAGTNALIKNGANMVRSAYDILEEYELLYPHRIFTEHITKRKYFVTKEETKAETLKKTGYPKIEKAKKSKKVTAEKEEPETVIEKPKTVDTSSYSDIELAVYDALGTSTVPDEIKAKASARLGREIGAAEILATLTTLEILGVCRALPGGNYTLS